MRRLADDVAEELQRRAVGPVQVVQDEEDRDRSRRRAQPPGDRVEQPGPLGLRVVVHGLPQAGHATGKLGHDPAELARE